MYQLHVFSLRVHEGILIALNKLHDVLGVARLDVLLESREGIGDGLEVRPDFRVLLHLFDLVYSYFIVEGGQWDGVVDGVDAEDHVSKLFASIGESVDEVKVVVAYEVLVVLADEEHEFSHAFEELLHF